jgi:hypothetical protein
MCIAMNGRAKGRAGEQQMCRWIAEHLNLNAERNLEQTRDGGADIVVHPFSFEVKRVENLDVDGAWHQCAVASKVNGHEPVLAFRKNREPWKFAVSARHIELDVGYVIMNERTFKRWALRYLGCTSHA